MTAAHILAVNNAAADMLASMDGRLAEARKEHQAALQAAEARVAELESERNKWRRLYMKLMWRMQR